VTTFLLGATVALLPLLIPSGPGNTAPADAFAIGFIALTFVALAQRHRRLETPAPFALTLMLFGSLIALALSADLRTGALTLVIDVYLVLLFVAVVNHLSGDERALRMVLVVWTIAALVWAATVIGEYYHALPGPIAALFHTSPNAIRFAGPARNLANLAASYLVTSFFVLLASPWPRRRPLRALAGGWLLLGMLATGSIGGLVGMTAGGAFLAVAAYLRGGRTSRQVQGLAGAGLLGASLLSISLLLTAGLPRIGQADVQTLSQRAKSGVLDASVGRADRSLAGRLTLWSSAFSITGPRALIGIGPGEAKNQLQISSGTLSRKGTLKVHSMHNDYLGFLIERGILGLAGLLALYVALGRRALRLASAGRRPGTGMPALGAALAANAADSLFHETFHYRHAIVLFALVWVAAGLVAEAGTTEDLHAATHAA
jgi:O-antigen ligase